MTDSIVWSQPPALALAMASVAVLQIARASGIAEADVNEQIAKALSVCLAAEAGDAEARGFVFACTHVMLQPANEIIAGREAKQGKTH